MKKYRLFTFLPLLFLLLSSCDGFSSSSSDDLSSEPTSVEDSSSEETSSEETSSEEEINQNQIIFARNVTIPELPAFPLVETTLYMDNVEFKFTGAKNYATLQLEARSAAFFLYNVDSLDHIYSIEVNLYQPKALENFVVYGGNSANPGEQDTLIPFNKLAPLKFVYDFTGHAFSHFRFQNGPIGLYLNNIIINFTDDFVYPEGPGQGGSETIYDPDAIGYYRADPENQSIDPQEYWYQSDRFPMSSLGNQKMLVVPVSFTDYPCVGSTCADRLDHIEKAFFGDSEDTSWESVSSYYYKSSYGKLNISGEVTPVYEAPYTANNFDALTRSTGDYYRYFIPTWQLADEVIAWYKTLPGSDISQYDNNGDGFVDALYMIYLNPNKTRANYTRGDNSEFWAYVYWNYDNYHAWDDKEIDSLDALPMIYSFSSFDFMYEGYGYAGIDAHTYIHETGHLLGLQDYYTYSENDWNAAGALDMMDNNILDHNPYSKLLWQWATPIVIDGTKEVTTIELSPYQDTGDFILINDQWNESSFDNYLALEFYTPTALNAKDSQAPYAGNNIQGFTIPGVKIYHIDSRLGKYVYDDTAGEYVFDNFTDELIYGDDYYSPIITSNSSGRTDFPEFKTVHLLESSGLNTFINGNRATDDTLFVEGDTFSASKHFSAFPIYEIYDIDSIVGKFNKNTDIGYEIEIIEITDTKAVIQITRIV
jgi:M6 family metalloprotease-like protein